MLFCLVVEELETQLAIPEVDTDEDDSSSSGEYAFDLPDIFNHPSQVKTLPTPPSDFGADAIEFEEIDHSLMMITLVCHILPITKSW